MGIEEKIEELAEKVEKVERENQLLKNRNQELENKVESLHSKLIKATGARQSRDKDDKEISRRSFLRKLGAGAVGIGALSLAPAASKLTITDTGIESSTGLDFLGSGSQYFKINDGGPVEVQNTNLRIPTGNAVEDGSGTARIELRSPATDFYDDDGVRGLSLSTGSRQIDAHSGRPFQIRDQEGSFIAAKYTTSSSSPGTLELTNAVQERPLESQGTTYVGWRFNGIGHSSAGIEERAQQTNNVGTTSTEITSDTYMGSVIFIAGEDTAGNNERFADIVLKTRDSITVIGSSGRNGPSGRNYTGTSSGLELAFDSGEYNVMANITTLFPDRG